ncbi:MAG: carboxy terminal-processing peptidase, partial [Planctomycetota bacterium]
ENFEISMRLELEGIGAELRAVDGFTVVTRILPGGAAEKDGRLKAQDKIVGVAQGEGGEFIDVVDMKLNDVVKKIRGKSGTIVRLQLLSEGSSDKQTIELTRAKIKLQEYQAQSKIMEQGQKPDGTPFRIGVIDLPSFYRDMSGASKGLKNFRSTTRDVDKILEDFRGEKVDAVILDLRNNGGGSLREAIDLTGLFIDQGPVVQVKDFYGQVSELKDEVPGVSWKGPLVVLTNKFSASGSEIFAGAIQDYGRGLIVGDPATHGKGTVQTFIHLESYFKPKSPDPPRLGALKITVQQFYRANGDSTQARGVIADVVLPSLTSQMEVGESDLDYSLEFDQVPPADHQKAGVVKKDLLVRLDMRSRERRRASENFRKVLENIQRYNERKHRTMLPLREEDFRRLNDDPDEDEPEDVKREDFYLQEALAITVDYIKFYDSPLVN